MRQVVLDTETTGLDWRTGDRVVEIGCVELLNRRRSGRTYHAYLNPERDMPADAERVHGLSSDFLADKPLFADIIDDFIDFIRGAELVIHNAAFDVGFLDYELSLLGEAYGRLGDRVTVEDSLLLARQRFPGQRNSLDALCKRLGVDNTHRQLHGALLDAQLLAEVYLAMTSGQSELGLSPSADGVAQAATKAKTAFDAGGERPRVRVDAADMEAHRARLAALQKKAGRCLWLEIEAADR